MLVPRSVTNRKVVVRTASLPTLATAKTLHSQQLSQVGKQGEAPLSSSGSSELASMTVAQQHSDIISQDGSRDQHTCLRQHDEAQIPLAVREPQCIVCGSFGEFVGGTDRHTVCSLKCQSLSLESKIPSPRSLDAPQATPVSKDSTIPTVRLPVSYASTKMVANVTGYRESSRTAALSSQEANKIREIHQIHVQGKQVPKPILSFEDCPLPAKMLSNLAENGFTQPRGVQMQAIPAGLCGRDMIISSETGSGKTAGFLIPILVHAYGLSQLPGNALEGPFVLILTPTRELAIQIEDVAKSIVKGMPNMRTALLVGGQAMTNQIHRLKQNIQVAIATPGRMLDIFAKNSIPFSNVFCLVLDEVDLMFSMGFRKQVTRILDILPVPPNGRQTTVCSATISRQIDQVIGKVLQNALNIRVGDIKEKKADAGQSNTKPSDVFSPASKIKQTILWVENESKKKQLFSLLRDPAYFRPPILIFVESRVGTELLSHAIQAKCPSIKAVAMHGEKSQVERSAVLRSIADGTVPVVVATGVLARGLDLNVATVINFDMAPSIQEYVHRVGRANPDAATKAAAGIRKGPKLGGMSWAITFINNDHRSILSEFANMLHKLEFGQVTPLPPQLKQLIAVPSQSHSANTSLHGDSQGSNSTKAPPSLPSKRKSDSADQLQRQHGPSTRSTKKRRRK
ncbi:P-loop containing nucleoside triphosphate hydrolase protein [Mortierella sp. GBAus27b]|nr:DEAD (Asp-Glu-Ala-Asp) box polypeptide 59 [Mortierella sp. GBA43]KAI8361891.1 P-loop containing nucleoside triphosphate hydrolase protein [Mortierella sp. GBAus27b]